MSDSYQILGGPGSPYSHKLRAVFRYRRIPHTWKVPQGAFSGGGSLGGDDGSEFAAAGKKTIPVVRYPDGAWWSDTTPIILDLEKRHEGRSLVPPHRGVAFLAHLIEDMADEFLPIPMFHYRWTDDQVWCSRRQMIGWMGAISDEDLDDRAQAFLDRQAAQLNRAAGGPQREPMEKAWTGFMSVMEEQLRHELFLFGSRPSLAEFAIYGQLTQYVADPTVSDMLRDTAIRTWQWTHLVDDLSGFEGEWFDEGTTSNPRIEAWLRYCADFYVPMNELILSLGRLDDLASAANGAAYRTKCYLGLKAELAALTEEERILIRPILQRSGCWDPLQFRAGESDRVVPILPI